MKVTVVLAHPDSHSFNHAIAKTVAERLSSIGHEVSLHDLHAESFDPILPAEEIPEDASLPESVASHCREIVTADGIVIVHPNWWGQPPAILKGWVDRVMRPGVAYRFLEGDDGEGAPEGLLKARAALVLNTSNTPDERERSVFGDPLQRTWVDCVFGLCGVSDVRRRVFGVVVTSTPEQRHAWLDEAGDLAMQCFPVEPEGLRGHSQPADRADSGARKLD
jgi:putative NADPH-quinone reductase